MKMKNVFNLSLAMFVASLSVISSHGQTIQILPTSDAYGRIAGSITAIAQVSGASSVGSMNFFLEDKNGVRTKLSSDLVFIIDGRGSMTGTAPSAGTYYLGASASVTSGGLGSLRTIYTTASFPVQIGPDNALRLLTPRLNVTAGVAVTVAAVADAPSGLRRLSNARFELIRPDGVFVNGATATFTTSGQASVTISPTFSGSAVVVVTGTTDGYSFTVRGDDPVSQSTANARLIGISTRGSLETSTGTLTGGFIIREGAKRVLIRVAGPALGLLGVPGTLPNPRFALRANGKDDILGENDDWGVDLTQAKRLIDAFAQTGAFPFPDGSRDAALIANLAPGGYTVQVSSVIPDQNGAVIIEVYEIPNP
jgi:hypothetical protein